MLLLASLVCYTLYNVSKNYYSRNAIAIEATGRIAQQQRGLKDEMQSFQNTTLFTIESACEITLKKFLEILSNYVDTELDNRLDDRFTSHDVQVAQLTSSERGDFSLFTALAV